MAKKVTITYTAISAPSADTAAQICATFVPTNAAADNAAFDGTYYDTNVAGVGEGMAVETFIKNSIAHPGLVLALKEAIANGTFEYTVDDELEAAYLEEVGSAVADQGFKITVADSDTASE